YEAVELARAAGAFVELAWAEENLSTSLVLSGDLAAAAAVLDEAIPRCRQLRLDQLPYLLIGQAALRSFRGGGSPDEMLDEAETLAPTADFRLHSASIRGDIALREARYADAVALFEECREVMHTLPGIVP